jgi:hypothetical protein
MGAPSAVGRLEPDGPWIGFVVRPDGPHLAVGLPDGRLRTSVASLDELLAAAIAYFAELLPDQPPQELEATHADVADLLRALVAQERDTARRKALVEALDAIDDGLASDAVVQRLLAARPTGLVDAGDPADVLRAAGVALGALS